MYLREYKRGDEKAVKEFNIRLKSLGANYQFPENYISAWLPKVPNAGIYQEYYLLFDNDNIVRGGYILKYQFFIINGKKLKIADYQLPLSEGIIDNKYNYIALVLYKNAIKKSNLLFALGMGGLDQKLPKMLKAFGWEIKLVPFHFKICNIKNFLNNIYYLRSKTSLLRIFNNHLILSIIKMVLWFYDFLKTRMSHLKVDYKVVSDFDIWVDDIWNQVKNNYEFIAERNLDSLNLLYPKNEKKYIKIKVYNDIKEAIGWCVVLKTKMVNHKQFGNMYLGSIVDCLCYDKYEKLVISAGLKYLNDNQVDLIVSNQSSTRWCHGLKENGFIHGPSNFALAVSNDLAKSFSDFKKSSSNFHINRGDGDGPINL